MTIKESSRQEYQARINQVMDYIEKNINQPLDLSVLAAIACFSPYHFHRMFTFLVGETPNNFMLRLRIERAALLLWDDNNMSISEIAYNCGFNNVSSFSRTFRRFFDMTAKEYRETEKGIFTVNGLRYSKNGKLLSKNGEKHLDLDSQFCSVEFKNIIIMNTKIEVKEMPEMQVVYCRHTGEFNQIHKAYEKVMKWAAPRGLLNFPETKTLTLYHDDPAVTDVKKVRQDACITVTKDVKVEDEIGKATVAGGKYAVGHFEITENEFEKAWNTMCLWFTDSGYQQADASPYELYYNDREHNEYCEGDGKIGEHKFILDICIPVKLL